MEVNKVEYNGDTLLDLTSDTVTPQTLLRGVTAHDRSGTAITGAADYSISGTTTGTAIALTDSADARVQDLRIYGRTESGSNVGDNGLTVEVYSANLYETENTFDGYVNGDDDIKPASGGRIIYTQCKPYTTYTVRKSAGVRFIVGETTVTPYFNVHVNNTIRDLTATEITITTSSTAKYVAAFVYLDSADTATAEEMLASCRIYETNILTVTTALPLRSNGDVKDEIDFADGQAITRIDSSGNVLATPVVTPLTPTEINAFRALRTFDNATNISATDSPSMTVTYIKDTANGEAVKAIEDNLQGQITTLNTAKQDKITQSATLTLTVNGWDSTLKTQTVTFAHDTTKRNVIDITVSELGDWAACGVVATGETASGISFKCEEIPESALTFTVCSMSVTAAN